MPWNPVDGNSGDDFFNTNVRLFDESNQNPTTHYTSIISITGLNWMKNVPQAIQQSNLVIFQSNLYSVMWSAVNLGWFVASFLNTRFTTVYLEYL